MKRKDGEKQERTHPRSNKPLTDIIQICEKCGETYKLREDQEPGKRTKWCPECRRFKTRVESMTMYMDSKPDRSSTVGFYKSSPHRKTSVTW